MTFAIELKLCSFAACHTMLPLQVLLCLALWATLAPFGPAAKLLGPCNQQLLIATCAFQAISGLDCCATGACDSNNRLAAEASVFVSLFSCPYVSDSPAPQNTPGRWCLLVILTDLSAFQPEAGPGLKPTGSGAAQMHQRLMAVRPPARTASQQDEAISHDLNSPPGRVQEHCWS